MLWFAETPFAHVVYLERELDCGWNREAEGGACGPHRLLQTEGVAHTSGSESVWADLKRSYRSTFHQWSPRLSQRFADEAAFRLCEGHDEPPTAERPGPSCLPLRRGRPGEDRITRCGSATV